MDARVMSEKILTFETATPLYEPGDTVYINGVKYTVVRIENSTQIVVKGLPWWTRLANWWRPLPNPLLALWRWLGLDDPRNGGRADNVLVGVLLVAALAFGLFMEWLLRQVERLQ